MCSNEVRFSWIRPSFKSVKAFATLLLLCLLIPVYGQEINGENEWQVFLDALEKAKPLPLPHDEVIRFTTEESDSEEHRRIVAYNLETGEASILPRDWNSGSPDADPPFQGRPFPANPVGLENQDEIPSRATPPSALTNTHVFPFTSIYKLLMRFNVGGVNYYYVCSAMSAGDFHLLSAGHCIYNHDPDGNGNTSDARWANEVWAWPAQTDLVDPINQADFPYGVSKATYFRSYTGWTNNQDLNHDWGVITLDRRIGSHTGWMGRETDQVNSLNFSGYPVETPYVPAGTLFQYFGFDTNNVVLYTTYRIQLEAFIYGGHSGGPSWRFNSSTGDRFIHGIHSTSNRVGSAFDTYLTNNKRSDLNGYMATDEIDRPPVNRPDLIEYMFDLNAKDLLTNSVQAGDSFQVEYNVLNAGFVNSGSITLDFYLSTNTIISTSDTPVGTVVLNGLDAFNFYNPTTLKPLDSKLEDVVPIR